MLNNDEIVKVELLKKEFQNQIKIQQNSEEEDEDIFNNISKSVLLAHYNFIYLYEIYEVINQPNTKIIILKLDYSIPNGKNGLGDYEVQAFGYKKTQTDNGVLLIRPETISDKINELITKVEIDFEEYPKFSKKYYVLSDDKNKVNLFLNDKKIKLIENINNVYIEVQNREIFVKFNNIITKENLQELIYLIKET